MIFGMDYLGGAKYKSAILSNHPRGWAAGFFDSEFGDCADVVKALIKSKACPIIRIQMLWSGTHSYGDKDKAKIIACAKKWERIQKDNPDVDIWLSCFCEHKIKDAAPYHNLVKLHAPSCGLINSPLKVGGLTISVWNEFHSTEEKPRASKSPILYSFDGKNAVDSDVETIKSNYSKAQVFWLWIPQFNLHKSMKKEDGALRDCVPTSWQIQSLAFLATKKGNTKAPLDSIYKSHADQHNAKPESRAGKPVLIIPDKGPKICAQTADGKVLATFDRDVVFKESRPGKPKRYIYRCVSDYGYNIAKKSLKLTGDPVLRIVAGGQEIGRLNLGFRDGSYR